VNTRITPCNNLGAAGNHGRAGLTWQFLPGGTSCSAITVRNCCFMDYFQSLMVWHEVCRDYYEK
jgi:hypothetical protein